MIRRQLNKISFNQVPHLKEIFIYWVDTNNPIPNLDFFGFKPNDGHIPVTILPTVSGFITDRFIAPENLSTDTVLIMDDDLVISGTELDRAFVVYKKNNFTDRIFGLRTRSFKKDKYNLFEYDRPYNMVITNFAFLNVKMLEYYHLPKYKELVDYCVKIRNCDDILMNYIASHEFKKSPIAINLDVIHLGVFGISFGKDHKEKRDKCCQMFTKHFGYDVVGTYESNSIFQKTW
ncbi:exostosin-2, putative [Trichomonas vaginalis G3]|uniref:Exostosin-2, putative n=1 Tax=Trichomonas vaginalis (strain ATCC PRA-98 / G3) TaxID=412133 RepID=A2G5Z8_TRIV3|nr:exostosin-like glycosyltransferase 3 family [Trichomonas vaginalis G3]EAX87416.1 exostosin-2, putative [Trichomonas vaginalis G3]KAI5543471.1 exostosin-like glycosyltransferase 3 family [Trichomonas vaginalis G3]|eukprot:XP_001300346.1 exostosin-2 [Trichomonas vaginalis G3]